MEIEAFITVHDMDLVRECEERQQFHGLSSHAYLFVGRRPVTEVPPGVRIFRPIEHTPNLEDHPSFYDYTGWWAMMQHEWIRSRYIITLQYDMFIQWPDIERRCVELLDAAPGPIAFTAGHYDAGNFMLGVDGFREAYCHAMYERGIDTETWERFNEWPSTQGMAWRAVEFENYLRWFKPFFALWKDEVWAGHLAERTVKAWTMERGAPERYLVGAIRHEARDCHGTGALMAGNRSLYEARNSTFRYQSS